MQRGKNYSKNTTSVIPVTSYMYTYLKQNKRKLFHFRFTNITNAYLDDTDWPGR